jgi:hypothetical protein
MPILRFTTWVGTALLALLLLADWQLPKPLPKPAGDTIRPVIRITSMQEPPERIIIDTSQPTIVPPPTLFTDAAPGEPSPPPKAYVSAEPPPAVTKVDQKKRKVVRRQEPKVADKPAALASAAAGSSGSPATPAPPTRLSFADIISGQLVKTLLNLN